MERCPMNLSQLYYFQKLAEVGNFTHAASELFISQPTLSVAISRLEEELGVPLFERRRSRVELTEAGREFSFFVNLSLKNLESGIAIVHEYAANLNSEIKLGTLYAMQGKEWSRAIRGFEESSGMSPRIDISQGYSVDLTRELKNGNLDVIFASRVSDDQTLNYTLCWGQHLVACVHKKNPLAKRKTIKLADLAGRKVITYRHPSPPHEVARSYLDGSGLDVEYGYDDEITMSSMVMAHPEYVALACYSFLVKAFDDMVFIPVEDAPTPFNKVYLISRREPHNKALSEFIDYIAQYQFPDSADMQNA